MTYALNLLQEFDTLLDTITVKVKQLIATVVMLIHTARIELKRPFMSPIICQNTEETVVRLRE
jgi:hypothetical protein